MPPPKRPRAKPDPDQQATAARVRALLTGRRGVLEKTMMGSLCFLVDDSMCCSVGPSGLLVRVTPDERDELLAREHVSPMALGARTMTGFVRVAPTAYRTDGDLAMWIERGIAAGAAKRRARR